MISTFDDPPLFHNHDAIRVLDRRQSVCNDKSSPSFHQCIHPFLHQTFGMRIDRTCCLIQDQDRRISYSRSCNSQQLSLTLTKITAITGQNGLIPIWKPTDKTVCICKFCCCYTFFITCIQFAIADIFHDGSCK